MVTIKTNKDNTLYDIVFADEIRADARKLRSEFSDKIEQIKKICVPYHKSIWEGVRLKNIPYRNWSSSDSIREIIEEIPTDSFILNEISDAIYQTIMNTSTRGWYI